MIFRFKHNGVLLTLDAYRDGPYYTMALFRSKRAHNLATVNFKIEGKHAFLCDIYIQTENERSKGLGTRLLTDAITFAKHKGLKSIYGFASPNGSRVYSFYERLGFNIYPESGKVELILSKEQTHD